MSSERPEEFSKPSVSSGRQPSNELPNSGTADDRGRSDHATSRETAVVVRGETVGEQQKSPPKDAPSNSDAASTDKSDDSNGRGATILVRGETIRDQEPKSSPKDSPSKDSSSKESASKDSPPKDSAPKDKEKEKSARKEVSPAKAKLQSRLPALGDDADVGVQKEQVVVRDGKADLAFTGTLLASAAPSSAPKGQWQEYRIYETSAGKHVFSKVKRSVYAEDQDTHEAEVFDPTPASVPSQLLRSARDLTRSRPLTWMDAAVAFFGYDPLAKTLYRKLGSQFEEHIS